MPLRRNTLPGIVKLHYVSRNSFCHRRTFRVRFSCWFTRRCWIIQPRHRDTDLTADVKLCWSNPESSQSEVTTKELDDGSLYRLRGEVSCFISTIFRRVMRCYDLCRIFSSHVRKTHDPSRALTPSHKGGCTGKRSKVGPAAPLRIC